MDSFFFSGGNVMLTLYSYNGPVMEFGKCIADRWVGYTYAPTKEKARSNLSYQFKKEHNRVPNARITLPNDILIEKGEEISGGVQLKLF